MQQFTPPKKKKKKETSKICEGKNIESSRIFSLSKRKKLKKN
jgi:hypothetical protein